jgi:hypothetical protein
MDIHPAIFKAAARPIPIKIITTIIITLRSITTSPISRSRSDAFSIICIEPIIAIAAIVTDAKITSKLIRKVNLSLTLNLDFLICLVYHKYPKLGKFNLIVSVFIKIEHI